MAKKKEPTKQDRGVEVVPDQALPEGWTPPSASLIPPPSVGSRYRRMSTGETTRDESVKSYPARFDSDTYDGLQMVALASGTSVNSVLNSLALDYLTSNEGQEKLLAARARQDDVIKKLSGG